MTTKNTAKTTKGRNKGKTARESRPQAGALTTAAVVTKTASGSDRTSWEGHSTCKLCKWFGANGFTTKQASAFLAAVGVAVNGSTLGCQFYSGRALAAGKPQTHPGAAAVLTDDQKAIVIATVGEPGAPIEKK